MEWCFCCPQPAGPGYRATDARSAHSHPAVSCFSPPRCLGSPAPVCGEAVCRPRMRGAITIREDGACPTQGSGHGPDSPFFSLGGCPIPRVAPKPRWEPWISGKECRLYFGQNLLSTYCMSNTVLTVPHRVWRWRRLRTHRSNL